MQGNIWKKETIKLEDVKMNFNSIKLRIGGGYFYERIKYLKKYASKDDKILQAYLEYCRYIYWHGTNKYQGNFYFKEGSKKTFFDNIEIPTLTKNAAGTFWYEFPDVLLPYLIERQGKKYAFSEITPLLAEGPYELNDKVRVKKNDVVIDCGANIGIFSAVASRKGAHVYAFEPDKNVTQKYLVKTAEYNGGIEICPFALSDHAGTGYFHPDSENIGAGRLGNKSDACTEVQTVTLDQFVTDNGIKKIDYIKADIEGSERDMLRGAVHVLKTFAPKLSVCTYHFPDDKEVLEKIVRDANPKYTVKHEYLKMYCWV